MPRRGTSNEYPQHMFSSRNKKNIDTCTFWWKKKCLCLKSANSVDPDKILSSAASDLGMTVCLDLSV